MEQLVRGSRERSQLRPRASPADETMQRHWEWHEDRRTDFQQGFSRYTMAFMASLDVKTAFHVAKPVKREMFGSKVQEDRSQGRAVWEKVTGERL